MKSLLPEEEILNLGATDFFLPQWLRYSMTLYEEHDVYWVESMVGGKQSLLETKSVLSPCLFLTFLLAFASNHNLHKVIPVISVTHKHDCLNYFDSKS